jgi:tetrahydromethanopterin S-methyltransferase subunit C
VGVAARVDYRTRPQLPSLLSHVQGHLAPTDPRRQQFERIAGKFGIPIQPGQQTTPPEPGTTISEAERGTVIGVVRAASSEALRGQQRVRSFRNVLLVTAGALALIALGIAVIGWLSPQTIPLCFQPESSSGTMVVCPTAQSELLLTGSVPDVDATVRGTASPQDLFVVEAIGLAAAAVAAAAALRGIRGTSEPYGLPAALALLKLPLGALTAVLGLLLMRGQFVPGLTALDTTGQILAWGLVFGYAQQLFTQLVDRQAHTVLNAVRGSGDRKAAPTDASTRQDRPAG